MTVKLSTLGVGDVIKAERTMKVTRVDNAYGDVQFEDVQSGQTFVVEFDSDQGSWKPELVSKAAPKFKVGDVIIDADRQPSSVNSLPVGTVLSTPSGDIQSKHLDGQWYFTGRSEPYPVSNMYAERTIVYLP